MKQYLDEQQTAKLIELGLEKPNTCLGVGTKEEAGDLELGYIWAYSIGELIKMLPEKVNDNHGHDAILQMTCFNGEWRVKYAGAYDVGLMIAHELIDALYYMLIDLLENDLIHLKSNDNTKDK